MTQMNISKKQKHMRRRREQTWLPSGRGWEEEWIGSLGLADETGIYGMNKQQGPTV